MLLIKFDHTEKEIDRFARILAAAKNNTRKAADAPYWEASCFTAEAKYLLETMVGFGCCETDSATVITKLNLLKEVD